jgi:hypothetical protein
MNTSTLHRPTRDRSSLRRAGAALLVLTIGVLVAMGLAELTRGPEFVDRIEIVNPTGVDVDVQVGADDDGWLTIAIVDARSKVVTRDVVDQGDVWTFRVLTYGRVMGELRRTRAQLEQADWRVTIPARLVAS